MTIIPAIDIMDGKVVRLEKGDFAMATVYEGDPLSVAKKFETAGLQRLHIVDLDAAKTGAIRNLKTLEDIARGTKLQIDFGGGVKTLGDVMSVLNAGAAMVTVGSIAAKQPQLIEEWLMELGADRFLIGADVLDGKVKISGWQEDSGLLLFDFIRQMLAAGVRQIFCTDISKDGMLQGPSLELYTNIIMEFPDLQLIASGGISHIEDIKALKTIGCWGAITGKAIYEGKIGLDELVNANEC